MSKDRQILEIREKNLVRRIYYFITKDPGPYHVRDEDSSKVEFLREDLRKVREELENLEGVGK